MFERTCLKRRRTARCHLSMLHLQARQRRVRQQQQQWKHRQERKRRLRQLRQQWNHPKEGESPRLQLWQPWGQRRSRSLHQAQNRQVLSYSWLVNKMFLRTDRRIDGLTDRMYATKNRMDLRQKNRKSHLFVSKSGRVKTVTGLTLSTISSNRSAPNHKRHKHQRQPAKMMWSPPEARGLRPMRFVPLRGTGTGFGELIVAWTIYIQSIFLLVLNIKEAFRDIWTILVMWWCKVLWFVTECPK